MGKLSVAYFVYERYEFALRQLYWRLVSCTPGVLLCAWSKSFVTALHFQSLEGSLDLCSAPRFSKNVRLV